MMTRDEAVTVVKDCFPAPYKFHDGGKDYLVVYQGGYDDPESLGVSVDLLGEGARDTASLRGRCSTIRVAYEEVLAEQLAKKVTST